ncbi:hypothetical protein D3C71_2042490 [compost metagenome]
MVTFVEEGVGATAFATTEFEARPRESPKSSVLLALASLSKLTDISLLFNTASRSVR